MEYSLLLENIIKVLSEKYPNEHFNKIIEETLGLDKLAVYRRVKGIVQFTAIEIAQLCTKLDLPLDNIFKVNSERDFQLTLYYNKFLKNSEKENSEKILEKTIEVLKKATDGENSKIIIGVTTILPEGLIIPYELISRVQICNWQYCNDIDHSHIQLANTEIPTQLKSLFQQYKKTLEKFDTTIYILYEDLFRLFFSNILFLYQIKIITQEEMKEIKEEMTIFLQDLEKLAVKGYENDPNHEVSIFISSFVVNNDYVFIDSTNMKLILFNAFNMNFISTTDIITFEQIKSWMKIITKSSILISGSGMKSRIEFFDKQYEYLNMLDV